MPTMPTPVSPPAPHSATDSSSASCWSNPWTVPSSIQEEVHRLKPVAALSSSSKAAALPPTPLESLSTLRRTRRLTAITLFFKLLERHASDGEKQPGRMFVRLASKRHSASRSLSSYRHCRSSSSLVEEMAAFSSSALTS
ncbi:Os01g0947800 [Oryza sativa Japonica Group]|uniref:Os01g0947800 protein n=1 Tax=Oryza sativa subsp. japonica TaxID=39947 RepID=A0A0P0VD10_ORYSJ|nr:hypothetical protein EE612_007956 [Oryza sativa]KAF2954298.1 hypothetical protein DAI22_01g471300 [Oryza sativa Japonica Group]BAS76210.1 Os01g0947800 [Oryza sativa Japonica Group]